MFCCSIFNTRLGTILGDMASIEGCLVKQEGADACLNLDDSSDDLNISIFTN